MRDYPRFLRKTGDSQCLGLVKASSQALNCLAVEFVQFCWAVSAVPPCFISFMDEVETQEFLAEVALVERTHKYSFVGGLQLSKGELLW